MESIIFSIDKVSDLHTLSKFLRYVDTLRAMDKLVGTFQFCVGSYKGELEYSFQVLALDFDRYIINSGFLTEQESIVRVSSDARQPLILEYLKTGKRVAVTQDEENWTHALSGR